MNRDEYFMKEAIRLSIEGLSDTEMNLLDLFW